MNIIVLDKDSREFKCNISAFESFIWTERYWDYGDFELVVPLNARNVSLISLNDYLKISTSDTLMIVENVEYISPLKDEGGKFNITGRSLDSIIDRRILFNDYKNSIKPEAYVLQIVKEAFGNSNQPNRFIDFLKVRDNSETDIETEPVSIDVSKGANLESIILPNLQRAELGFRITFNRDNTFLFEVFAGEDKSYIVFSENNLLLQEAQVYRSVKNLKTFVLVGGDKTDVEVEVTVDTPIGIHRRETYTSGYVGVSKDDPSYRKELELRGKNELDDAKKVETIEARLMNFGRYKLRRDYDLGDIITIQNPYYKATARVTEVIQSWNQEGYQIYPGFIIKDLDVVSYKATETNKPEPKPEPKPETPDIPVDHTPRKLINVEIISAIKMYTNFIIGGTSRTHHQIYIPNYDPSEPKNPPIKRFGVRLRGLLPDGWVSGLYTVYCDVFLGSEQKLETIKVTFNEGDSSFVGNWYSYLTYNSPYIRLYLYVVANEIGLVDISDDQEPFMNGLVDIRLNNVEGQEYIPSDEGDQLTCQTTYIWENSGNFHRYCSTNSTNVTGIPNVDITVLRQSSMSNKSMLTELENFIDSGMRSYEYDTVSLDNVELAPLEVGIVEVPPTGGIYDIPAIATQFENEVIGNFGWRQTVAEVIRSNFANSRTVSGSNTQEMNLLFKRYEESVPEGYLAFSNIHHTLYLDTIDCKQSASINAYFYNYNKTIKNAFFKINIILGSDYLYCKVHIRLYTKTPYKGKDIINKKFYESTTMTTEVINYVSLYEQIIVEVEYYPVTYPLVFPNTRKYSSITLDSHFNYFGVGTVNYNDDIVVFEGDGYKTYNIKNIFNSKSYPFEYDCRFSYSRYERSYAITANDRGIRSDFNKNFGTEFIYKDKNIRNPDKKESIEFSFTNPSYFNLLQKSDEPYMIHEKQPYLNVIERIRSLYANSKVYKKVQSSITYHPNTISYESFSNKCKENVDSVIHIEIENEDNYFDFEDKFIPLSYTDYFLENMTVYTSVYNKISRKIIFANGKIKEV